jgi:hypothetical protein
MTATNLRAELRPAIRELVQKILLTELKGRWLRCSACSRYWPAMSIAVRRCGSCLYTTAACVKCGGAVRAERGVRCHMAWLAGKAGVKRYGDFQHAAWRERDAA